MAGAKEIKTHIASVGETRKITNAMYLIASTKLRRARQELDQTRPYFEALRGEIRRIFHTAYNVDSRFFYPIGNDAPLQGSYGCLLITADKGLAGAYNQNAWGSMGGAISPSGTSPLSTASSTPPRIPPWPGPGRSALCCWTALTGES